MADSSVRPDWPGAIGSVLLIAAGGGAGWAVMHFVMEAPYTFEPLSALGVVAGGVAGVLLAGLGFVLRPLSVRPAQVLRAAG